MKGQLSHITRAFEILNRLTYRLGLLQANTSLCAVKQLQTKIMTTAKNLNCARLGSITGFVGALNRDHLTKIQNGHCLPFLTTDMSEKSYTRLGGNCTFSGVIVVFMIALGYHVCIFSE